ncbi:mitochondrial nicotinamide adenine dinucleotide transporter SLC25A51 isoform X2 [Tamandua tetradactyla]|uniref:mitochondrial nicotinamide adenine dinucleotide transporter SLC25A51 isoform X2 n=1 Tax=Tamandua tetradactyla TaxID=48850 RepID=UPI00405484ED
MGEKIEPDFSEERKELAATQYRALSALLRTQPPATEGLGAHSRRTVSMFSPLSFSSPASSTTKQRPLEQLRPRAPSSGCLSRPPGKMAPPGGRRPRATTAPACRARGGVTGASARCARGLREKGRLREQTLPGKVVAKGSESPGRLGWLLPAPGEDGGAELRPRPQPGSAATGALGRRNPHRSTAVTWANCRPLQASIFNPV